MCVLASPVFAAPTVSVTNGGLDASGNWIWNVSVSNSNPVPSGSSPLAAELGFKETVSTLKSAANTSTGAGVDFDTINPGKSIFGWELPGTGTNNNPEGVQTNCAAGCTVNVPGNNPNAVFAALGSIDFATVGPHSLIKIITAGPKATSPTSAANLRTSTIVMSGAYAGNGRVAEGLTATTSANYDTFAGTFTRTATPGDTNLAGGVDLTDFNTVLGKIGIGTTWQNGNFHGNGTGTTDLSDFNTVLGNIGAVSGGAGSSLGAGSAVPEPASILLVAMGLAGFAARRRR